ncbi:MAG: hypothetical protein V4581_16735 [Bacteroidota bacterium]
MKTDLVKTLVAIAQEVYKVDPLDRCRARNNVWARSAIIAVLRAEAYPYSFITARIGLHHATAMFTMRRHEENMQFDRAYKELFNQFILQVNMPSLKKLYTLEITPEQFLNACSPAELMELELLLYSPSVRARMQQDENTNTIGQ